jgi:hypothetical protein
MLDHKLRAIHAKRVALSRLEDELKIALTKCEAQPKRPGPRKKGRCPVLMVFGKSKPNGAG